MPVRKLTRLGAGENSGDADAASGGTPDPLGAGKVQNRQELPSVPIIRHTQAMAEPARQEPEQEPGQEDERGSEPRHGSAEEPQAETESGPVFLVSKPVQASPPSYSPERLQQAAAEVISQLHSAKQELAQELEANLKQLKAVLKETQRIAKDMEAVLKEAKAEPNADQLAQGGGDQGGKQKKEPWNPPGLKKSAGKQQTPDWDAEDDADEDQEQQSKVPQWQPPQDALQPQQH